MVKPKKLKPKEALFCYYYASLQNAREAALKAGYPIITAEKLGNKLLQRNEITKKIKSLCESLNTEALTQKVIAGLCRLAFANTNDSIKLILKQKQQLDLCVDELDLFHISEIKIPKENAIEIKFFDRFKALDKLIELINKQKDKSQTNEFYAALEKSALQINQGEDND